MRIKSYFAASVQAAIAMARKEFGDAVTLVTSHVAAPDSRCLGEYEVVFAVEEGQPTAVAARPELMPEPVAFNGFQQLLLDAVGRKPQALDEVAEKLDGVRCALIDLGLDPATACAVMTLIEKSLPAALPRPAATPNEREMEVLKPIAPVVSIESRRYPHLSPAELSFISAVAEAPGAARVQNR